MEFQPGDVVIVRSGGVPMTITSIVGEEVHCHWMDAKQKPQRGSFPAAALKKFVRQGPMRFTF